MTWTPTDEMREAVARALFYRSFGARMQLWHWPGDEPREVPISAYFLDTGKPPMTISGDHPDAPGEGKGPDKLRQHATAALSALAPHIAAALDAARREEREAAERLRDALRSLEPYKRRADESDGPCCHERGEDGVWVSTGCYCANYDDAQAAADWAADMNAWEKWNRIARPLLDAAAAIRARGQE